MGLFIAAEKRPRLTNIDFLFSVGGNQRPIIIHCLLVGGWGQKVQIILKPESKLQEALVDQIALCVYCDFPQKYFMETVLLVMHISEFEYKHNLLNTRLTQN